MSVNISKPMVSVVVLCYRQEQFLKNALLSVFRQDYPSLELLVADDGTDTFSVKDWEDYIRANAKENVVRFDVHTNNPNLGTVKNLNGALKRASGKYILFFAADDALATDTALSGMVSAIEAADGNVFCISGLASRMDAELKNSSGYFQNAYIRSEGTLKPETAHRKLLYECCYTMGATLFLREVLLANGGFDENYHVIEDWSFYLSFTKNGGTIHFADRPVLLHRQGGISENTDYSPVYKEDLKQIYEKEIFPYLREEKDRRRRVEIILHYSSIFGRDRRFMKTCFLNCGSVMIYFIKKITGGKNG